MSYISEEMMQNMAREIVMDAIEYAVDMMEQCPEEYSTFDDVQRTLSNAPDTAEDIFLEDQIKYITERLTYYVKNTKVVAQSLAVNAKGFQSVDYKLEMLRK